MNADIRDDLQTAMSALSRLYPDMRFGQLVEMLALLASEDSPCEPSEVEDTQLLQASIAHLESRLDQLGVARPVLNQRPLHAERRDLLEVLRRLQQLHADWRFGQAAVQVAGWCAATLYDAEDQQMVVAARKHLRGEAA